MDRMRTPAIRIHQKVPRLSAELVACFVGAPTGNVCDAMDRYGALDYEIHPLEPATSLCGPALTVRTRPGDNLAIYKALEIAQPGDVLVIATYGFTATSTFGDLVALIAKRKGIAGIVCDGVCRDARGIRATGLPVFVRGTIPSSPGKDGPGEINGPICCGGATVLPGDIVVGDEDGVVVVPARIAEETARRLEAVKEKEARMLADIEAGVCTPKTIAEKLEAKGVQIVG